MDATEIEQAKEMNNELVIAFDPVKLTLRTEKIRNLDRKSCLTP